MSQNEYDNNPQVGSITGFTTISPDGIDPSQISPLEYDFKLEDIFIELKEVSRLINDDKLFTLIELIQQHISDKNNPHVTSLKTMNTDSMQELYKLWLKSGYVGSEEVFVKVLFQYLEIADTVETLEGKNRNKIVSVFNAKELVENHNDDFVAHQLIFDSLFPGTKFNTPCTFSMHSTVGIPSSLKTVRNSTMQIVGPDSRIKTLDKNTMEIDYTFKEGYIPIFGYSQNNILYSDNMMSGLWIPIIADSTGRSSSIEASTTFPLKQDTTPTRLTATPDMNTIQGINYHSGIDVQADHTYTFSVFVRPEKITCFGLSVNIEVSGSYPFVHFDLKDKLIYTHGTNTPDMISGGIAELSNGWCRIWMTFKSRANTTCIPSIYLLDVYNSDRLFTPIGSDSSASLFGPQINEGSSMTSYITSTDTPGILEPSMCYIDFDYIGREWFNPEAGTFVFKLKNINTVSSELETSPSITNNARYICSLGSLDNVAPTFELNFIAGLRYIQLKNRNNTDTVILDKSVPTVDRDNLTLVWSYDNTQQFLGRATVATPEVWDVTSSLKSNIDVLMVGCDTSGKNMLEGYIEAIYYYPFNCDIPNVAFFLGEPQ